MCARAKKELLSFEQAAARLEDIVARMNSSDTGLEEMISLTEEGLKLIQSSRSILREAELRIQKLEMPDTNNETGFTPQNKTNDEFSLI